MEERRGDADGSEAGCVGAGDSQCSDKQRAGNSQCNGSLHALAKDGQCRTLDSKADGYAQSEECAQSGNVWEDSTPLLPTAVKRRYTFHTQPKWLMYTWSHEAQLQAKVCTRWQRMDSAGQSTAGLMVTLSLRSVVQCCWGS